MNIPEHSQYEVGETARFVIGSYEIDEAIHVELWGGNCMLSHKLLTGTGIRVFEVPVTELHKGGFTLRWFGVKNFTVRASEVSIRVPWKEKQLTAKLTYAKKLAPGQKVRWSLEAKDLKATIDRMAHPRTYHHARCQDRSALRRNRHTKRPHGARRDTTLLPRR